MQTIITSRKTDLSEAMKTYIEAAVDGLGKYQLDITAARVVVQNHEKKGDKKGERRKRPRVSVDLTLNLAHFGTLVISAEDKDFYAALDDAAARMHKVLRRLHDRKSAKHAEVEQTVAAPVLEDEIVPADLDLHKPLEIEEALLRLKSSSQQFFVFNDKDLKMRVIYKRTDGKYGLY